ncbi:MAG: MBL fold metallo-hydrolase [Chloroflexota bacterium]
MFLRYFFDENLAQASYFIGDVDSGEAIIIDPARHIQPYIDLAAEQGFNIVAATETHIHADFVSGARELADRLDVTLLMSDEGGDGWQYTYLEDYTHALLKDGDTFEIGDVKFDVIHTPGHTPEHLSFIVTDAGFEEPFAIFTGDFVFVGDLGRPDLLEKAANEAGSAEALARQMFTSVERFKQLPDYLLVYPGHGAGSPCGKVMGAVPSSTVGYEKRFNVMLQHTDEDAFVAALLAGQTTPPNYFAVMKRENKEGPKLLSEADRADNLPPLVLRNALEKGATVVDTRPRDEFAARHLHGTINIEHTLSFALRAGDLIDYNQPFYVITDSPHEVKRDLQSVGLDNLAGTFKLSTFSTIERTSDIPFESYESQTPEQLQSAIESGDVTVLDVRRDDEWNAGHIPGAVHIPLGQLQARLAEVPDGKPVVVHCKSGVRSAVAASILQANDVNVVNMAGGHDAWQKSQTETA